MMQAAFQPGPPDGIRRPVGVIDIGSNSVRLVVYDSVSRAPSPIFNEKALCGLGRNVALTGELPEDGMLQALTALRRFRALADIIEVEHLYPLATAAARYATNGPAFIADCEEILRTKVEVLSGEREAELAALGVVAGVFRPHGLVADLGGGSLELIDIAGDRLGSGVSLKLGGLALRDTSGKSLKKAARIVEAALSDTPMVRSGQDRAIYAIGGTWRAIARLHMRHAGYPLNVLHGYSIRAREAMDFCRMVLRVDPESLPAIASVASDRRPLLAYGALVLESLLRHSRAEQVIVSATGVREGVLYELLDPGARSEDPLQCAARDFNNLRSRSPEYGVELVDWTKRLFETAGLEEEPADTRLREGACLLSDISWRAHPDYRGEQSLNMIAHAVLPGVDHPGRTFLALSVYYRHVGPLTADPAPRIRELASTRQIERARILGAAMRVAYIASAAMPGILGQVPLFCEERRLMLRVPFALRDMANERLFNRLRQLAKLLGREARIDIV